MHRRISSSSVEYYPILVVFSRSLHEPLDLDVAWSELDKTFPHFFSETFHQGSPRPNSHKTFVNPRLRVDTAEIVAIRNSAAAQLWDARDRKEFVGEELKKGAYRAGRIPGSKHSDWALFKKKDNQAEWLSAPELAPLLQQLGYDRSKEQYFYCQSGVRAFIYRTIREVSLFD